MFQFDVLRSVSGGELEPNLEQYVTWGRSLPLRLDWTSNMSAHGFPMRRAPKIRPEIFN